MSVMREPISDGTGPRNPHVHKPHANIVIPPTKSPAWAFSPVTSGVGCGESFYMRKKDMTITEVYDKFNHLDDLLSDRRWLKGEDLASYVLYELWQAVKEELNNQPDIQKQAREMMDLEFEQMAQS